MLLPKVDLNRLKKEVKEEALPRLEFLEKILSPLEEREQITLRIDSIIKTGHRTFF